MKTETLKSKINELILTGQTSFKGCQSGQNKWLSDRTFNQLSDFLNHYKNSNTTELKRTSETSATLSVYKDDELIIFGNVNFY